MPVTGFPKPDWEKTKVFLVDPAIWPFYRKEPHDLRPVYRDLTAAFDSLGIEYQLLTRRDHPVDIWIRDWGFVEDCYFEYCPSYARNLYSPAAIKRARTALTKHAGHSFHSLPLVLDGGNLIHNGKIAIVTEKALWDNRHLNRQEVERLILSLGFEQLVFIPVEPEDEVGHADGILRFLSPNLLLVNDYDHPDFGDYRQRLFTCLESANMPVRIVPFPWTYTDEKRDGVWSAVGTYINFILTKQGVIYPIFGHSNDKRVASLLRALVKIRMVSIFAAPLARLGGVLNCIVQPA